MEEIVNKVANSGLITLDLEEILEHPRHIKEIDIKDFLFQGLLLREKDFRQRMKELDWSQYKNSIVAIHNSNEAIVPKWAYMIIATNLANNCDYFQICNPTNLLERYYVWQAEQHDFSRYQDKRIILKGCGDVEIPASIYLAFSNKLTNVCKTLMFGEPCSTVPVFKKK